MVKGSIRSHCNRDHEFTPENTYIWKHIRRCRTCLSARAKIFNGTEKRKERQKSWKKNWIRNNPNCHRKWNLKHKYGMSLQEFDALIIAQSGRCSICNEELRDPFVDHDHITSKVRNLLCVNCNMGIGHFMESKGLLQNAIAYLEKNNAGKPE